MKHELKIEKQYLDRVLDRTKTFEIRKNDRDYQKGDKVTFKEVKSGNATGKEATADITYVTDYQQKEGYVVFSLANVLKTKDEEEPKTIQFMRYLNDLTDKLDKESRTPSILQAKFGDKTAFEIHHEMESKIEEANRRSSVDDSQGRCEKCGEKAQLENYRRTADYHSCFTYRPIWLCKVCGQKVQNYERVRAKEKTIAEQIDELPNWDAIDERYTFFRFQPSGEIYYSAIRPDLATNGKWAYGSMFVNAGLAPEHLCQHYKESLRERPAKEAKK